MAPALPESHFYEPPDFSVACLRGATDTMSYCRIAEQRADGPMEIGRVMIDLAQLRQEGIAQENDDEDAVLAAVRFKVIQEIVTVAGSSRGKFVARFYSHKGERLLGTRTVEVIPMYEAGAPAPGSRPSTAGEVDIMAAFPALSASGEAFRRMIESVYSMFGVLPRVRQFIEDGYMSVIRQKDEIIAQQQQVIAQREARIHALEEMLADGDGGTRAPAVSEAQIEKAGSLLKETLAPAFKLFGEISPLANLAPLASQLDPALLARLADPAVQKALATDRARTTLNMVLSQGLDGLIHSAAEEV